METFPDERSHNEMEYFDDDWSVHPKEDSPNRLIARPNGFTLPSTD